MKKNEIFGIIIKLIIIISSIYGIIRLYNGMLIFSYFTILSNIFICIMSFVFLVKDMVYLVKKKELHFDNGIYIAKFLATVSIVITFLVYLIVLAPTNDVGMINAYLEKGAGSLCVHFIVPLLSIIDFLYYNGKYILLKIHSVYTVIPPLFYVVLIFILSNLGVKWGNMPVPYNFLNYCSETGWFGINLTLFSKNTLGIGVFYNIIVLAFLFILIGLSFICLKKKADVSLKHCN